MKCSTPIFAAIAVLILSFSFSIAQDLSVNIATAKHSKNLAKKGLYGGTYLVNEGGARVFYIFSNKKKGLAFDAYDFDVEGNFKSVDPEIRDIKTLESKFDIKPPESSPNKKFATNQEIMIVRTNALGVLVMDKGILRANYDTDFSPPFFTGYQFESQEKKKPKIKILPSGFIPLGDVMDATVSSGAFQRVLEGSGEETVMMGNSSVMVAGIIKEKIVISKNPPPYNNNRFACLIVHGEGLEIKKENIFEMPFAMVPVVTGKVGEDVNFVYSTLQAPTTVKVTNQLSMKDEDRKFMMYIRANKDAELVDTVKFRSFSVRGMFGVFENEGDVYIPGFVNDGHGGSYRWDVGSISHFQWVKISGGKMEFLKTISLEDIEAKLSVPKGEKAKFKLSTNVQRGQFTFTKLKKLGNGDLLLMGQTLMQYFAVQLTPDGEIKRFYKFERIDKEFRHFAFTTHEFNGAVYFLIQETPPDVTQGVHTSSSRYSTSVLRIDDVFNKGILVKLDPDKMTLGEQIDLGEKKYYILGAEPLLFDDKTKHIYIPGTDRKKTLYMTTVK